jgi:protease-4
MSKTAKTLLIVFGVLIVFALVAVIGLALFLEFSGRKTVASNSVMVARISGEMPDFSPEDPTAALFGVAQPQSLTAFVSNLKKAKADARIGGVLLDIDFPGIGWGKADEIREAIADFKTSGKPIYAYMEVGSNKEYYIATAADKVFLPPAGDLYINGLAAEVMFYRGTLDKIGVEMEMVQIGKYKNAPDQYTRKDMSEGHREVMNAILDDYYNRLVAAVAESRKKSPEDVKAMIDAAPFDAVKAEKQGLIDGALFRDQIYAEFKKVLGYNEKDELRLITGRDYRESSRDSLNFGRGERVAVIFAAGPINTGRSSNGGGFEGERIGSDTVVKAVNDAAKDDSIKAIVLRVDSPGGSALASDLMWHAIENAKKKKPVVVSMSDVAASGGYYIACNADKIVAQPSTLTGSIGVFMGKPVVKGLYDWAGISNEYIMRGKNAGLFRETEKWTPEERAKMEESTRKIYYDEFVPKVAAGRKKTAEEVDGMAQGRVWTGVQAKERGLVDELGGFDKAVEVAKQLANIPEETPVRRVVFPEPLPFIESFFEQDNETTVKAEAEKALFETMPEDARRLIRYAGIFDMMKRGEAMTLLPFELKIK